MRDYKETDTDYNGNALGWPDIRFRLVWIPPVKIRIFQYIGSVFRFDYNQITQTLSPSKHQFGNPAIDCAVAHLTPNEVEFLAPSIVEGETSYVYSWIGSIGNM